MLKSSALKNSHSYDFVIVGGGSAGCVLANRLSACGQFTVCLLEAGPEDKSPLIKIPAAVATLIQWGKYNWKFNSQKETSLDGREVYCPRGKTLGGSSAINAMVYIRGQKEDYQRWLKNGAIGWGYEDLLPYFKRTMKQNNDAKTYSGQHHGFDGELQVSHLNHIQPISKDFVQAAQDIGIPHNPDFNGAQQEGIGLYQTTTQNGRRCSSADGFLTPIRHRKNLTVLTTCRAAKVIFDNGAATTEDNFPNLQATGIQLINGEVIQANKEVILSAGAFQSPQLLNLSGIGIKEDLEQHDISCLIDAPEVGRNLQEHVDVVVVNRAKNKKIKQAALSFSPSMFFRVLKETWRYFSPLNSSKKYQGLFSSSLIEAGGFIKSDVDKCTPDLQLMCTPALFNDHGRDIRFMMGWGFSIHVTNLQPKSRGCVSLRDANPLSAPNIQLNLLDQQEDYTSLIKGIRKARDIFSSGVMQTYQPEEIFPGNDLQTDEQLKSFIKENANHVYHPVGSCRMGNDKKSVVDTNLKVRGTTNLRIIDASVFPDQISGNPNATIIAMAAKAADILLKN